MNNHTSNEPLIHPLETSNSEFGLAIKEIEELHYGKELSSINKILGIPDYEINKRIVCYVSGYDCGGCVRKGLDFLKYLASEGFSTCLIVTPETNVNLFRTAYNYKAPIYKDLDGRINKDIPSNFSPVIFGLDKNRIISEFHPRNSDNDKIIEEKKSKFLRDFLAE